MAYGRGSDNAEASARCRLHRDDLFRFMNTQPLVSIVTPAFNQAEFLAATIESVLAQDYPRIEYIIIDDGSTDASLSIARRYERDGVRVLTQANAGQAATLNRGWSECKGDILAYLSSDDCLVPGTVSTMVRALMSQQDAVVAYCDCWLIDAAGHRLREVRTEVFDRRRMSVDLVCQPGPATFFRRVVFEHTGGWNPALRQVPDFDFWLRAMSLGSFLRVPECLAEYRMHEGSASFRTMSVERAEEMVGVMRHHWQSQPGAAAQTAIARALLIAAKNHAQSGRLWVSLKRFLAALGTRPRLSFELGVWRQWLVGMTRRAWYQLRTVTSKP